VVVDPVVSPPSSASSLDDGKTGVEVPHPDAPLHGEVPGPFHFVPPNDYAPPLPQRRRGGASWPNRGARTSYRVLLGYHEAPRLNRVEVAHVETASPPWGQRIPRRFPKLYRISIE